jgi:type IV secretion system protein VirB2
MHRQHNNNNNTAASPFAGSAHAPTLRDLAIAALIVMPSLAMAAADGGLGDTTCTFLKTIVGVLNAVSIVVVTIAIIFSGYQIAFAHKRISDVAPVFIGALIIGAASQIAKLFLSGSSGMGGGTKCDFASIAVDPLTQLAGIVQSLAHYA